MKLREHPLMICGGVVNWPPIWIWTGGEKNAEIHRVLKPSGRFAIYDIVAGPGWTRLCGDRAEPGQKPGGESLCLVQVVLEMR